MKTVKAIYEGGVFKPLESIDLDEHTEVQVLIPMRSVIDPEDPTGWRTAEELIGFIEDAPPDMAENHDRWLKS